MRTGFTCNICGGETPPEADILHREARVCVHCGSNARFRAVTLSLTEGLFGQPRRLPDVAVDRAVMGFGCSDADPYASRLEKLFNYTNTYYHTKPRLDICDWNTFGAYRNARFTICTDVLEHTMPEPLVGLSNLYHTLAPGGVLVVSAPTYSLDATIEKYPGATNCKVVKEGDDYIVNYDTPLGEWKTDRKPIFHGGPGSVLEMRIMSHAKMMADLATAGFRDVSIPNTNFEEYGAVWPSVVERSDTDALLDGRVILARK